MIVRLKKRAQKLKQEIRLYNLVLRDERTPCFSRVVLGLAVGYVLLPFDLIPDWIPVIGYLDDIIIVPLLVFSAMKFIPGEVIEENRMKVKATPAGRNPETLNN